MQPFLKKNKIDFLNKNAAYKCNLGKFIQQT